MTSTDRDVKKNPPSRIPASNTHNGVGMKGKIFALAGNRYRDFKYPHVKQG